MNLETYQKLSVIFGNHHLKVICIDADDTLWHDSRYFREIENLLTDYCQAQGLERGKISGLLDEKRKNHHPGEAGFAAAAWELANTVELESTKLTELRVVLDKFLSHPVELLPRAKETLALLSKYQRVLLTKGKESEQQRKLNIADLTEMLDRVIILEKKGTTELAKVFEKLGNKGFEALVIGNSVKHDIIPAIENGASAIYINHSENVHGRNRLLPAQACEVEGWSEIEEAVRTKML